MRSFKVLPVFAFAASALLGCSVPEPDFSEPADSTSDALSHDVVKAWITSDPKHPFEVQPSAPLGNATAPADSIGTIVVDDSKPRQRVEGFGAALTDASAAILHYELGATKRKEVLEKLVSKTNGIGLDMVRLPMAASDSTWNGRYSYDDWGDAHGGDKSLSHFSISHDEEYIIPELKEMLSMNGDIRIIATPWSPPGWMKEHNAGMIGGNLRADMRSAYAEYFVHFVRAYWLDHHIPIYAVVPQNEPGQPANYPSMTLSPSDEATFVTKFLSPALDKANFPWVKILGFDHNWGDSYPNELLGDLAGDHSLDSIDGLAFHCYGGNPAGNAEAMTKLHDDPRMAGKEIYMTECDRAETPSGQNSGHSEGIQKLIYAMNNWSRTYMSWQLVLHPDGTPNQGSGCMKKDANGNVVWHCVGVVSVAHGSVENEWDYAYLGHASKFVERGAHAVAVAPLGPVESVAFVNPNGLRVLVAYNSDEAEHSFQVSWQGKTFNATIPKRSAATFTW